MSVTFETYTRNFGVADEKKETICLFKLSKGGDLKKDFGKPWYY